MPDVNDPRFAEPPLGRPATRPITSEHASARRGEPGIADLVKDLRDEAQTLFRQEVALAKTEISQKVSRAKNNAIWLGAGVAGLALGGIFVLLAVAQLIGSLFEILGVAELAAAAIGHGLVGAIVGIVGYVLLKKALHAFAQQQITPEHTLDTLKEDAQWLKNRIK